MSEVKCPFCDIAARKMDAKIVFESEEAIAFLDINPRARGHTVLVPKKHYATLADMPKPEIHALFGAAADIMKKLSKNLHTDGFNVGTNSGVVAGQIIPHVFIHIIPRFPDDEVQGGFEQAFPVKKEMRLELDEVLNEIQTGVRPQKSKEKSYKKRLPTEEELAEEWSFTNFDDVAD